MIRTHKSAIEISHSKAIKRINEFYQKEFYDALEEFEDKIIKNNNNRKNLGKHENQNKIKIEIITYKS